MVIHSPLWIVINANEHTDRGLGQTDIREAYKSFLIEQKKCVLNAFVHFDVSPSD